MCVCAQGEWIIEDIELDGRMQVEANTRNANLLDGINKSSSDFK